jgi:hypothetical protein
MSYLIYVNGLGPNYKGDNIYEFIFSDVKDDVWDESWESKPSNGNPLPPDIELIRKVGVLKNDEVKLSLIQDSDFFSMTDALDDVIALAWESEDSDVNFDIEKRLVFRFGEDEKTIKNKLYERDIVLEFDKQVVYEKE